jgi:hypothetical protein
MSVRRQVLAGTIVLLVLRLALSTLRTGPLVVADEIGYLTNARVLTGGVRGQLELAPFYRGGYSLLIAPLVSLGLSPSTTYHLILVVNALLAASLVPLLYLLFVRMFRLAPQAAVAGAIVGATYPSLTLLSQVAMSENLLAPLFVVWLIGAGRLVEAAAPGARAAWAVGVCACGVALFAVHGRMIVVVALSIALVLGLAAARRLSWWAAAGAAAVTAAGLLAVHELDQFLITTSYGGHPPDEAGSRLSSLEHLASTASVLRNTAGQTWYMLVATLALPLVVLSAGHLRDRVARLRHGPPVAPIVLCLLLASAAGLLALSALSFADPERADMFVYGRYVEIVAPPLLGLAVAWLVSTTRRPRVMIVLGSLAVATGIAVVLRQTFTPARPSNRLNIAGLPSPPFQLTASSLVIAGVAAAFWAVLAIAVARRRPLLVVPLLLVSFALTTANVVRNPLLSGERVTYGSGWVNPGPVLRDTKVVSYDRHSQDIIGLYAYQWFAPHTRFVLTGGPSGPLRTRYLIASHRWPARHPGIRVDEVWRDPNRDQVIYRVVGSSP